MPNLPLGLEDKQEERLENNSRGYWRVILRKIFQNDPINTIKGLNQEQYLSFVDNFNRIAQKYDKISEQNLKQQI